LFASIETVQRAAQQRIGTGVLNRLLRQAFEANPPRLVRGRRLKLFYAAQSRGKEDRLVDGGGLETPELPRAIETRQRARGARASRLQSSFFSSMIRADE